MDALAAYGAATGSIAVILSGLNAARAIRRDRQVGEARVDVAMVGGSGEARRKVMIEATNRSPFPVKVTAAGVQLASGQIMGFPAGPTLPVDLSPHGGTVRVHLDPTLSGRRPDAEPVRGYVAVEGFDLFWSGAPEGSPAIVPQPVVVGVDPNANVLLFGWSTGRRRRRFRRR